jgi:glycine/D-amino acid oxidase-like deaminating enzyme
MQYNFIIIGQGIAGTVLGFELLSRGKKILILDNAHKSSSSVVAAGLYNPVVFKRFVKSWMADELIPATEDFYTRMENLTGKKYLHQKEILKIFSSEEEKMLWEKKSVENIFMKGVFPEAECPDGVFAPFGGGIVSGSGWVDMGEVINDFKNYFKQEEIYLEDEFDENDMIIKEDHIQWKEQRAEKIIFCEGSNALHNKWFSGLPFKLTHGEVLSVEIKGLESKRVINKGVFILPIKEDIYKVGATYEWNKLTGKPSEEGIRELKEKLEKLISLPYKIHEHQAGIRPTVSDRRPLIGLHPENNRLAIFNGMGTKAVLLAPYFAMHFADFLEGKKELSKEVDIARYWI